MGRSSKREDWREREALFRYGLVREAASERLSPRERGQLVRALAGRPVEHPSGELRAPARTTLDDWIRAYRRGGSERAHDRALPASAGALAGAPGGARTGLRPLRGRRPERAVGGGRAARPAAQGPTRLPLLRPRRPLALRRRGALPVGGDDARARGRAPHRLLRARPARLALRRQRLAVRLEAAAADLRRARDPARAQRPRSTARPRQAGTAVSHRPRPLPGRARPARARLARRAQQPLPRLAAAGLPPARARRDEADAARALHRERTQAGGRRRRARAFAGGVPLAGAAHRRQDGDRLAAGQPLRGRRRPRRLSRRAVLRPLRARADRGPLPGPPVRARRPAHDRPPRPPGG